MVKSLKKYAFRPDYAVPPGETLREVLESFGMNQRDLADRTGLTVQSINRILKGEQPVTFETANRLELVTGVEAGFWNNLEARYREQRARLEERERLISELAWLKTIPTRELIRRKAIPDTEDRVSLLREVLKFFAVSDVAAWQTVWQKPAVATRRSLCFETRPGPAATWLRLGEIEASRRECAPYDKERFRSVLETIRTLTTQPPEEFELRMTSLCASAGVALALVQEIPKVPWNGATRWLSAEKAMILLTLRHKTEDHFWFSFFHEAGHVLHDPKRHTWINSGTSANLHEQNADAFAAEFLIPRAWNDHIRVATTKKEIIDLARKIGVSPGIVAGRYQHLTRKWDFFNDLKISFHWAEACRPC